MSKYASWRKHSVLDIPVCGSTMLGDCVKRTVEYLDEYCGHFIVKDMEKDCIVFDSEAGSPDELPSLVYNKSDLQAELDNDSVTLYLFGASVIEMTRDEFKQMANVVLAAMEVEDESWR